MPKKTKNQIVRDSDGLYGDYKFYVDHQALFYEASIAQKLDLPSASEYFKTYTDFSTTASNAPQVYGKIKTDDIIKMNNVGGNPELKTKLLDVEEKIKKEADEYMDNLDEYGEHFKEYLKLNLIHFTPGLSHADALYNNSIFSALTLVPGCGPLIQTKDIQGKKVVDFKSLEERLRKPDGKGYFVPYMALCKAANSLWETESFRQQNERIGWTPETIADYKAKYYEGLKAFTTAYADFKRTVEKTPDQWQMGSELQNKSTELTSSEGGSTRDVSYIVEYMKGEMKAIENGWEIDELPVLGSLKEHISLTETSLINAKSNLESKKESLASAQKTLDEDKKNLAILEKHRDEVLNSETLNEHDKLNRGLINWYAEYSEGLRKLEILPKNDDTKKQIESYKKENAKRLEKYEIYKSEQDAMTGESLIAELKEKIKSGENQVSRLSNYVEIYNNAVNIYNVTLQASQKLWDKASTKTNPSLEDKKAYLEEIQKIMGDNKDVVISETGAHYNKTYNKFKTTLDNLKTKYETGFGEDIINNQFLADKLKFHLDIYGPNPVYHNEWEKKTDPATKQDSGYNVIKKEAFESTFKPYDTKGLPFTPLEMVFLGEAGTLTARKQITDKYKDGADKDMTFEQQLAKNASMWLEISHEQYGPRENFEEFKDIVQAGRENALKAAKEYAKGNKTQVAAMIHGLLYTISRDMRTAKTMSANSAYYYAALSTLTGLLVKDPKLMDEFKTYNSKQPGVKKVDLREIANQKNLAKLYAESYNDAIKLKDFEENVLPDLKTEYEDILNNPVYQNIKPTHPDYDSAMANLADANAAKWGADDRHLRLQLGALRNTVLNHVLREQDMYASRKPVIQTALKKYYEDVQDPKKMGLALGEFNLFKTQNIGENLPQQFIGRPEGHNDLDNFTDRMIEKYKLGLDGTIPEENKEKYSYECQKFLLECTNKEMLLRIREGRLSKEQIRDYATDYMMNLHQIKELDFAIETGMLRTFANKTDYYYDTNYEKNNLYFENLKSFTKNMDLNGSPAEIAAILESGSENLAQIADTIEKITDQDLADTMAERQRYIKFTSIKDAVDALKATEMKLGTKEYTNILKDMEKLNTKAELNVQDFEIRGYYDAIDLMKTEKGLLERLDKYIARKEKEIKAGDTSTNSKSRMDSAKKARRILQKRLEEDSRAPYILRENDKDIAAVKVSINTSKKSINNDIYDNTAKYEISGKDMLKSEMDENKYQLKNAASKLNADNMSQVVKPEAYNDLKKYAKNALYLDLLKNGLGPQKGDSKELIAHKDKMTKEKLIAGIDAKMDKELSRIILSTTFGEKYIEAVVNKALDPAHNPDEAFSQENMMTLRDKALRDSYKAAMKNKDTRKRTKDAKAILDIATSLGSKELKPELKKYKEAEAAFKKKQALEAGKKTIVNNNIKK